MGSRADLGRRLPPEPTPTNATPGIVPNDLRRRIDHATVDFAERHLAVHVAHLLGGVSPRALDEDARERFAARYGYERAELDRCLELLEHVGYGRPRPAPRPPRARCPGAELERRFRRFHGKLPRAIALRLPTSADTHAAEPLEGSADRWGRIWCSRVLRSIHLGALAFLCGRWMADGTGEGEVELTARELAYVVLGRRDPDGRDVARVYAVLADWAGLKLRASFDHKGEGAGHEIPESPVAGVWRRLDGQWLTLPEYAAALGPGESGSGRSGQSGTIRVRLAPWVLRELRHERRRPVFVNFSVWRYLGQVGRRLYVLMQALDRGYDGRLYFWLAEPQRVTFGLRGKRLDQAAAIVRHALTELYHADRRYLGFGETKHARTRYPAFTVRVGEGAPSTLRPAAQASRAPARRPRSLRGRLRGKRRIDAHDIELRDLHPEHRRRVGEEYAREEAALVRQAILDSFAQAGDEPRAGPAR